MKTYVTTQLYQSGIYLQNNKTWHTEDSPYKAAFVIEIIEKNKIDFENCADIGCGAGLVLELLAKQYPNKALAGFEPSPDAQHLISQRAKLENLRFYEKNFFESDETFDLVTCLDVL
jgi:2-polyprenyl-3-methyl-5-hydroxy-6-metoxy-1,4-benzoquinol methylase